MPLLHLQQISSKHSFESCISPVLPSAESSRNNVHHKRRLWQLWSAPKPFWSRATSISIPPPDAFSASRKDTDMPSFEHHGARIYYEEFGQGFPILTFAPAGLQSVIDVWSQPSAPINPTTEFTDKFRVIALAQRNAGGQSRAPITAQDSWDSYTADHLALLAHLRIDKCHLYGQCIGGSFIINMLKRAPERVAAAVLAQPIGRIGPMAPGGERNLQG